MAPIPSRIPSRLFPSEIFSDTSSCSCEDDSISHDNLNNLDSVSSTLRSLSIPQLLNRQSTDQPTRCTEDSLTTRLDSLTARLSNLCIDNTTPRGSNSNDNPKNQTRRRLTRPAITPSTFETLETVLEDEIQCASKLAPKIVSNEIEVQGVFQLPTPGEKFADHPLVAIARKGVGSAQEQLAKHRSGWFEGILSTKVPIESPTSESNVASEFTDLHCGFNLLPIQDSAESQNPDKAPNPISFTILLTPLAPGEELLVDTEEDTDEENMALAEPAKGLEVSSAASAQPTSTPVSPASERGMHLKLDTTPSRQSAKPIARIEDSVQALDELEDQLEAFDEAALFRRIISPDAGDVRSKSITHSLSVATAGVKRATTPQPKRSTPSRADSAFLSIQSSSEPRRTIRKSASMIFLDPPKLGTEGKLVNQGPARKLPSKGIASLNPPKQQPKSVKKLTVPTFELPGDEVARKLKEKREARVSTQIAAEQAIKPTVSSLRRAKSARPPTRPNFELPGEAISRRKREEREAQLKAQEEEEKKRREFKARPIRSSALPSTFPRETIASRARQNKKQLVENSLYQAPLSPNKPPSTASSTNSASRSPLSKANNQSQPRGRGLHPEPFGMQSSRATSSSTVGSMSGQRSPVSTEEVQQQRLRGQEIYKRDNSWSGDREREKREREALAKLAREEAAERSRQRGREWAAKQAKKRMTVASYHDIMA